MEPNKLKHTDKHISVCVTNLTEAACVALGPAVTVTHSLVRVQFSSIILPYFYVRSDHFSQPLVHRDIMKHTCSYLSQTMGEEEKNGSAACCLKGSHVTAVSVNGFLEV